MKLNALALSGFVAAAIAVTPALAAHKSLGPSDEALALLKSVQSKASDVEENAAELQRLNDGSWQTHTVRLQAVKDDVNSMGHMFARLEALRDDVAPEERAAIDRLAPMLKSLAADTQAAITYLSETRRDFWVPAYADHINKLESVSNEVYGNLGHVVALVNVAAKEKRLEKTLGTESGM